MGSRGKGAGPKTGTVALVHRKNDLIREPGHGDRPELPEKKPCSTDWLDRQWRCPTTRCRANPNIDALGFSTKAFADKSKELPVGRPCGRTECGRIGRQSLR